VHGVGYGRPVGPSPEIARALPGEHAAILALHREAGWPGTNLDGEVWAARAAGELIGSTQLIELAPGLILIDAAVVRAEARGRGIGSEMLRAVLATRSAEWWLECREERVAFYERLGFAVEPQPAVPLPVLARVGANSTRRQYFLRWGLSP
jgi:GNAT superfamily N-acetyltransferase